MLKIPVARRLKRWGTNGLFVSLAVLALGASLAYVAYESLPISVQFLGHLLVGIGGVGLKSGYIMRLAALDALEPHPEGWQSLEGRKRSLAVVPEGAVNPMRSRLVA
jgi:hypothetical protein